MAEETIESRMPGLPSLFTVPQQFRDSLPADVQTWLTRIEAQIDGLHLEDIEEQAQEIAGGDPRKAREIFRIARRLFFLRVEQIINIMEPDLDAELGIDLPLGENYGGTPGAEADRAISDYEMQEGMEQIRKERREQAARQSAGSETAAA